MRNIPLTWTLARVFVYVPPFISQILDFIYWTVFIFILIYFEWSDTENQQYFKELLNEQEYYWRTIYRAGAVVSSKRPPMVHDKVVAYGRLHCHIILTLQAEISQIDIRQ